MQDSTQPNQTPEVTMSNTTITVGTRVRALDTRDIGEGYRGEVGTVKSTGNHGSFRIAFDNEASLPLGDGGTWSSDSVEVIEAAKPERPTILLDHQTSRDYAYAADSRVLDAPHRAILQKAAEGHPVDAYAFNAAITAAMSSAATRCAQSSQRRSLTSKIRHLAYKTQAVLENHADALPAYAEGQRSRLVEDLRDEVNTLKYKVVALDSELVGARSACETWIETAATLSHSAGRQSEILDYALSLLDEVGRARVQGYTDRLDSTRP